MRSVPACIGLLLYIALMALPASAQFNDQNLAEIKKMHWAPATGLSLTRSQATMTRLPDYVGVVGTEAARLETIAGNDIPGVEAHLTNPKTGAEAILSYAPTGFVRSDDWDKIDAQEFLDQVSKNTEAANADRTSKKISPLHVDGWVQVPTFK